jgi:hypothetical protein
MFVSSVNEFLSFLFCFVCICLCFLVAFALFALVAGSCITVVNLLYPWPALCAICATGGRSETAIKETLTYSAREPKAKCFQCGIYFNPQSRHWQVGAECSPRPRPSAPTLVLEDNHATNESTSNETDRCVVCLGSPRTVVVEPCRHFAVCETCSELVRDCPVCRGVIVRRLTVYKS